jgi:hypothetical protein
MVGLQFRGRECVSKLCRLGGYHVPFGHKALASDLSLDTYTTTVHKTYSVQVRRSSSTVRVYTLL